jgi:hypothetical protein
VLRAFELLQGSARRDVARLAGRLLHHTDHEIRAAALRYYASTDASAEMFRRGMDGESPPVRATALVGACEVNRRESIERGDDRGGHEPFRIGLRVGQRMTPHTTEASYQAALQLRGAAPGAVMASGLIIPFAMCGTGAPGDGTQQTRM